MGLAPEGAAVGATPGSRLPAQPGGAAREPGEVRGDSPQPRQDVQQLQSWEGTGGHWRMGRLPLRPVPGLTPTTHSAELVGQEGNPLPRVAGAVGLWEDHTGHTWCPGTVTPQPAGPPSTWQPSTEIPPALLSRGPEALRPLKAAGGQEASRPKQSPPPGPWRGARGIAPEAGSAGRVAAAQGRGQGYR